MDLKKWQFGTPMGEQIEEQNANIDRIDTELTEQNANIDRIDTELTEQNANIDRIDTELTEQNANIDRIDKFIIAGNWQDVVMDSNWVPYMTGESLQVKDCGWFYMLRGRIKPLDKALVVNGAVIGTLPFSISKTSGFVVGAVGTASGVGTIYTQLNRLHNRSIGQSVTQLTFDGIIIPK